MLRFLWQVVYRGMTREVGAEPAPIDLLYVQSIVPDYNLALRPTLWRYSIIIDKNQQTNAIPGRIME